MFTSKKNILHIESPKREEDGLRRFDIRRPSRNDLRSNSIHQLAGMSLAQDEFGDWYLDGEWLDEESCDALGLFYND